MKTPSAIIVGAGIVGRLLAFELTRRGWRIQLFDRAPIEKSCSYAAAGLLDATGTLEDSPDVIGRLGEASLERWPQILGALDEKVYFGRRGSLAVSHPQDFPFLEEMFRRLSKRVPPTCLESVEAARLCALEPEIDSRFQRGLYFPLEGHLDTRQLLQALGHQFVSLGVDCIWNESVEEASAHEVRTPRKNYRADFVVDCRGLEARSTLADLRGVRGELFLVEAPEVSLSRPIRLFHPKYPLYVIPREGNRYVIGATLIESEALGGMSVRSALELLSAAFALHPGFAEAEILENVVQYRPAFSNHLPKLDAVNGVYYLNGLFRHGYLVSPYLVELAADYLESKPKHEGFEEIYGEGLCA